MLLFTQKHFSLFMSRNKSKKNALSLAAGCCLLSLVILRYFSLSTPVEIELLTYDSALINETSSDPTFFARYQFPLNPTIFSCGHPVGDLYSQIIPEHQKKANNPVVIEFNSSVELAVQVLQEYHANSNDIALVGEWGCNSKLNATFWHRYFPGRVVHIDGEGFPYQVWPLPERQCLLGRLKESNKKKQNGGCQPHRAMRLMYLSQHFAVHRELWPAMLPWYEGDNKEGAAPFDSTVSLTRKPQSTRQKFLLYAHSNCVDFRDESFDRIAREFPDRNLEFAGECSGNDQSITNKIFLKTHKGHGWHHSNHRLMNNYRFCLVMENRNLDGYITEKILNAFVGGCIPIYYGTPLVMEIFNPGAFIYYNISNPEPALLEMARLEYNQTAYREIARREPILLEGRKTIEKYFAVSNEIISNSALREQLRKFIIVATSQTPSCPEKEQRHLSSLFW